MDNVHCYLKVLICFTLSYVNKHLILFAFMEI
jgi:hypothetical protein